MPRDGSGVYTTLAGTHGIPDTTIASTPYNLNVDDVATDLNAPRPIIAGGTGASSAAGARTNLAVERSNQVVTNFSSHVWEFGSFSSAAGATGAPTANAFSGIAYGTDSNNLVVEARDRSTGIQYVRRKVSGAWQAWVIDGTDQYVNVTGDTMTGGLTLAAGNLTMAAGNVTMALSATPNWSQYVIFNGGASAQPSLAAFQWSLNITEHNVAARYSFDVRATGDGAAFYRPLTMAFASGSASHGIVFDGNAAKKPVVQAFGQQWFVGENGVAARFVFDIDATAGFLNIVPTTAATSPTTGALRVAGGVGVAKQIFSGGHHINEQGTADTFIPWQAAAYGAVIEFTGSPVSFGLGMKVKTGVYPWPLQQFFNASNTAVGKIEILAGGGGVAFTSLSDIRLKTAMVPYQGGLAVIEALQVHQYEWAAAPGESYVGLAAQEANEVFPQAVSPGNDKQQGEEGFIPWMIDNGALVPVLIAAVQELSARVAALEAQLKEART